MTVTTQYGAYTAIRKKDGTVGKKYQILSKADHDELVARGAKFKKEKKAADDGVNFYPGATPEERIYERGIRVKADKKAGIKGKSPTLIREKELKYIAKIHGISPEITSSIIQHAGTINYVSPPAPLTRGAVHKHILTPAQRTAIRKKEAKLDDFMV